GAGVGLEVDVGRSLNVIASLLRLTGRADDALTTLRRSESLLEGPAGSDPRARAALAACRTELGWLLSRTGRPREALEAYRRARVDQEERASSPGSSNGARQDLVSTLSGIGFLLMDTGQHAEAESAFRNAISQQEELVEGTPSSAGFRASL